MNTPIISCNIMGGLGNQLFQIMTTMSYAIRNKCVFLFPYDTKVLNRYTFWDTFLSNIKQFTTNNINSKFKNMDLDYFPKYREPGFHYTPIPVFGKSFFLNGYFQSYKYFENEKTSIFKMIHLEEKRQLVKSEFSHYFYTEEGGEDNDKPVLISMHLRIGDYKNLPTYHPILPIEYYRKSLEYLFLHNGLNEKKCKILYCCEEVDNETVLLNIHYLKNVFPQKSLEFVKVSDDICDWKQMIIMSLCDHHIIANSTFSWWSAYFNSNGDKIVCYPSIWFGVSLQHNKVIDMYPLGWTRIDI